MSRARRARGSALITAIVFALIVALTLAGVSTLTVSHYALAHTESASTAALDLAEAGINYELTRITDNVKNADKISSGYQAASVIDASLRGTFYVRCVDPNNASADWNGKDKLGIVCTGLINGAQRTVSIEAQPSSTFYIAYAVGSSTSGGQLAFNGEKDVVKAQTGQSGQVGTDGTLYINPNLNSKPAIPGVVFDGPNAGWYNNHDPGGYSATVNPKPVAWETVTQKIGEASVGVSGGLANTNDNALATYEDNTPAIVNQHLVNNGSDPNHLTITLKGKAPVNGVVQPANYYLTALDLEGNTDLKFDNTNGPINVYYVAPTNATGSGAVIQGGQSVKTLLDAPGHNVNLFSSATGNMILRPDSNNDPIEMGIYAYDTVTRKGKTQAYGGVNLSPNINFTGQIIANSINIYDNVSITGERGYFDAPSEYYAFSGNWRQWAGDGSSGQFGGGDQ